MNDRYAVKTKSGTLISDPPLATFLFSDTRFAPVWAIIRVLLGWTWLESGWGKITDPGWIQTGESLRAFWERIVVVPETGRPVITYDWYRGFIQGMLDSGSYTWFAKLVALGEVMIGIALIVGIFVGIAAFFGAFMNWNFMLAGSASTNPVLMVAAIFLVLAWKTAGYYGLDHYLLPRLGTPWQWWMNRKHADVALQATA